MTYEAVKEAILNVKRFGKNGKDIPLSVVIICDREWLAIGKLFSLYYMLKIMLVENY
jgi:hypothetical protein